jgi:hypothetical protein
MQTQVHPVYISDPPEDGLIGNNLLQEELHCCNSTACGYFAYCHSLIRHGADETHTDRKFFLLAE